MSTNDKPIEIVNGRNYSRELARLLWQKQRRGPVSRYWEAFKDIAILFSFTVNFIMVLVLLVVVLALGPFKQVFVSPLMGQVWGELQALDNAKIQTTVKIDQQVPIAFPVNVVENPTTVRLTAPVSMAMPARFVLPGGGGTINGTVTVVMPAGTRLPIVIENMTIAISHQVPIRFDQPVTIYLHDTELHGSIKNFQDILGPFYELLK